MARTKGQPKTGGRQQGTQNKISVELKTWVSALIDHNRRLFENDLKSVEPVQRLAIMEKMLAYCVPKLQSLDTKEQIRLEYLELERLLKASPDEAVQRIADKIMTLRELSNQK